MCSLIITIACVIPNMLPELIAPGTAFIYIEEIYFASISDKGNMGYGIVWFIILNVGCILTFFVAILVFCIVKRRRNYLARIQEFDSNNSSLSRRSIITFIFITRFSLLWYFFIVIQLIFLKNKQIVSIIINLLYVNCIGDGTVHFYINPRYRKLRGDLVRKIACQSKIFSYAVRCFI